MLKTDIKWLREALCCRTGTKLALISGLKHPVLIGGGRMPFFLVVEEFHRAIGQRAYRVDEQSTRVADLIVQAVFKATKLGSDT